MNKKIYSQELLVNIVAKQYDNFPICLKFKKNIIFVSSIYNIYI